MNLADNLQKQLAALKAAAEKTGKGEWFTVDILESFTGFTGNDIGDIEFIATCSPDRILALVAAVEKLVERNRRMEEAIKKNGTCSICNGAKVYVNWGGDSFPCDCRDGLSEWARDALRSDTLPERRYPVVPTNRRRVLARRNERD